ncbi:extracellular solute-binding protein [Streptomyces sp. NPDC000070]|uniref:ABC transporter substrate-binding protein n=1 Tax=Streptomyces sp. NPDC000070 TaxID=3154240 RepID=UPI003329F8A7
MKSGEETKSLEQLYREAKAEDGTLTVYAGGDTATQQDGNKAAFEKAFPGITLNIVLDYSKFHDARIDSQLATGSLVPDVVQLQTLQDFPRWKHEGALLPYKPAGFSRVHPAFKDPDGAWTGIFVDAFSMIYNVDKADGTAPASARDLLDPRWRGKIVSTYPNDDDAVLYLYSLVVEKYGWDWLRRFVAQDVAWVRGTQEHADPGGGHEDPLRRPEARPVHGLGPARRHIQAREASRRREAVPELVAVEADAVRLLHVVGAHRRPAPRGLPPRLGVPQRPPRRLRGLHDEPGARRALQAATHPLRRRGDGSTSPGWLGLHPGR